MKIYIIASGWDRELVMKTVFKAGADKICLITAKQKKGHTYSKTDKITRKVTQYLEKELSKFTPVDILEVNYIDLKESVVQFNKYLKTNKGAEFIINISTGSRMLCATLTLLASMHGIPLEYSVAKNHNPNIMKLIEQGQDYHTGFTGIIQLPAVPFKVQFSPKETALLKQISKSKFLTVKDYVKGATGNAENRKRSEFHYLVKKLESQGFVEVKSKAGRVEVSLTAFGEIWLT